MPMLPARHSSTVVRFGVFETDLHSGELRKNGVRVKIQDLPFKALKLLLSHPNEALSRDQFRRALWPEDVFVDFDHGISSAINRLRDALGDSAENPVFIETVDRRGYRWIAPTSVPASASMPPGPILVKPQPEPPFPDAGNPPVPDRRLWSLLLLLSAFLGIWIFWPNHRAAKAETTKKPDGAVTTSNPRPAANLEAEQLYLKGRFYWEKRTADGLNKSVDYFTQAIVHDPNYAPAYVGLANSYNLLREYTLMPASEAYPRALAAARRAVELDDQSSEAHASLAFALYYGTWDAAGAEREFRRAIDLNPSSPVAHHWYATYLATLDRLPEAVTEIERAQTLDPGSKSILADKGSLLWSAGKRDEGVALLKQLEASEPDFVSPHRYLKRIYFATGDYPHYLDEWKNEATLLHDRSGLKLVDSTEKGYAAGGSRGMLQNMQALQQKLYERGQQSPYAVAQTDSLLGNKQGALLYLNIAYDKRDEALVEVESDPAFTNLHDDPAYKDLIAKLGFPARK
jgi:DNA-binding winged helix-turn-helix (wHTH) protein/tetratricopeptide (TPR) repeat protein